MQAVDTGWLMTLTVALIGGVGAIYKLLGRSAQVEQLADRVAEMQREIDRLKDKLDELYDERSGFQGQIATLRAENAILGKRVSELDASNQRLCEENRQLKEAQRGLL